MSVDDTVILHDLFTIKGGGERLVMTLCQALEADLVIGQHATESFDLDALPGLVTDLSALSRFHGIKTVTLARAFKKLKPTRHYGQAVYSGVCAPLARTQVSAGRHLFYCHTPPRFLYDKANHYEAQLSWPARMALKALNAWFKPQYEAAVADMDVVITNSQYVKKRIKHHLGVDAEVVYPPVDVGHFRWQKAGDYYLSLARLDGLKRVAAIIDAFKDMPDQRLVVASGGAEADDLIKKAEPHENIKFTGWLNETELQSLLGGCLATLYVPEDEDFGMSPVESMSAGKPVICSDHGGPLESVIDGKTGWHVGGDDHHALVESIKQVVKSTPHHAIHQMREACESRAQDFKTVHFIENIKKYF